MSRLIDLSGNNLRFNYSDTVENILCTATTTRFLNEIDLSGGMTVSLTNSFNYTNNMIGYTVRTFGTGAAITPNTDTVFDISVNTLTLSPGIYLIYLFIPAIPAIAPTYINKISMGFSTSKDSFTGGTGEITTLSNM